jgi:ribosome-associated heat shock protein Hsp15
MDDNAVQVRIDKWLWAARFFKTRSLATKAATGGKVYINGQRTKPSRAVAVGDELTIHKGQMEWVIVVLGLSGKRGPAPVARTLYEETEESIQKRADQKQERSLFYAGQTMPAKRPGKRDRRKIKDFIRKGE